jgi:hypothetical protein
MVLSLASCCVLYLSASIQVIELCVCLLLLLLLLRLLQEDEKTRGKDDGAESGGVTGTDATMTDAGQTPEPGTTPEPDDKGDALAALLAAGGLGGSARVGVYVAAYSRLI